MRPDQLTAQDLVEIVQLYEEHCGNKNRHFENRMYMPPDALLDDIRERFTFPGRAEYRVGSRWDGHSKIIFDEEDEKLIVRFNENFDPSDRKGRIYKQACKAGDEFVTAAAAYLRRRDEELSAKNI